MAESAQNKLADELAIRNLQARYCDAINRRDADAMENTWAPDGVWKIMGKTLEGRNNIMVFWKQAMARFPKILQFYFPAGLKMDGLSAVCRWYIHETVIDTKEKSLQFFGVYNDTCNKVENEWLFSRRRFDLIYQGAGPLDTAGWQGYPHDMNTSL